MGVTRSELTEVNPHILVKMTNRELGEILLRRSIEIFLEEDERIFIEEENYTLKFIKKGEFVYIGIFNCNNLSQQKKLDILKAFQ